MYLALIFVSLELRVHFLIKHQIVEYLEYVYIAFWRKIIEVESAIRKLI